MAKDSQSILIIGCGSIGSRHARNLSTLDVPSITLCDPDEERGIALGSALTVTQVNHKPSIDHALKEGHNINAAVIASPSSMHVEHALKCVRAGLHLLIEKPLSNSLKDLDSLLHEVESRGAIAMMAMCYRFHPVFLRLKEVLDEGELGRIYHANYFGGHYLPDWHPERDYRYEYAAKRELGGGVVLTSIHGLDNIRWLFGDVTEVAAFTEHVSGLELDVEDMAAAIMKTEKDIYINMYSDFLNRIGQHRMVITASLGTIECDFISGEIRQFTAKDGLWSEEKVDFDVNSMYTGEISYFLSLLHSPHPVEPDLADGIKTLKLALALKESSSERKFITL